MHGHCDILQQHMTDMFFCLNTGYPQSTSEKLEKISSTGFPISWEGAGSFPKRCGLERLGRNQKPSKSYSSSDPGSTFYAKFGRTYCRPSVCTLKNCVLSNNVRTFTTFAAVFGGSRNINNFLSANIKKLEPPFRV